MNQFHQTLKIQPKHLARQAVVYVRQSTLQQIHRHQESTRLQYSLKEHAEGMGWMDPHISIIDEDLGRSGVSGEGRSGFQRLLGEIALNQVGIILGVEMSRLARSCRDWYHLLELCALFGTLIYDLDGLYDPSLYNDRLLLGLKGTMSEAELHIISQRMREGKLAKARRGDLAMGLPTGYVHSLDGQVILDPDEQVQSVIRLIFDRFSQLGTLNALLRDLVADGIKLGMRVNLRGLAPELEWRRPNRVTLSNILHNPIYTGAYVYGRRPTDIRRKKPGRPSTGRLVADPGEWAVCLKDHLPAYITWERYMQNLTRLSENQSRWDVRGAPREGAAWLQGILMCGRCGRRMAVRYGKASRPRYTCERANIDYGEARCQGLSAAPLDEAAAGLLLSGLKPAALELSLQAWDDLEQQRAGKEAHWKQQLERSEYEADRARRQFEQVEPENRLVGRTLEANWEKKLKEHDRLKMEYESFMRSKARCLTGNEREQIHRLASDLPGIWYSNSTTHQERKAILRHVIEKVVAKVDGDTEWVDMTVHWIGGHKSEARIQRPVARFDQMSIYGSLIEKIRTLENDGLSMMEIAETLNREGWKPAKRAKAFNSGMVAALLARNRPARIRRSSKTLAEKLGPDEWWVPDISRKLDVPLPTLYAWCRSGKIKSRQLDGSQGRWIVQANPEDIRILKLNKKNIKGKLNYDTEAI